MSEGLTIKRIAVFSDIFDEVPESIEFYLSGICKATLLKAATLFLSFKSYDSKYHDNRTFITMVFGPENNQLANDIYSRLNLNIESDTPPLIVSHISSLNLFEICLKSENSLNVDIKSDSEIEVSLFKAYLVLNTQFDNNQHTAFISSDEPHDENRVARLFLTQLFPYDDIINYDLIKVFTCQLIKSVYFFELLSSHKDSRLLLNEFIKHYGCSSWQYFLKNLMPLIHSVLKSDKETYTDIIVNHEDVNALAFIDKFSLSLDWHEDESDFKIIRQNPLYKVETGRYRIIFGLFLIEKLFKSTYFKLKEINQSLIKTYRIKNLNSFLRDNFSEKHLFYTTIDSIYPVKCKKSSGEEIRTKFKVDSEPDFYIRNGNKVFLFESKDIMIDASKKTSFDYPTIELELKKKLLGTIDDRKAIFQLLFNVKKILASELAFDPDLKPKNVRIYPILVMHERLFNTSGLNKILSSWFFNELQNYIPKSISTSNVKPLVVIDIDTLLYYQEFFENKSIKLENVLDDYYNYLESNTDHPLKNANEPMRFIGKSVEPFSSFLSNKLAPVMMSHVPKLLRTKGIQMFN